MVRPTDVLTCYLARRRLGALVDGVGVARFASALGDVNAYAEKLVLVRPDQHVAWRGDEAPSAPLELIDRVRGARAIGRN